VLNRIDSIFPRLRELLIHLKQLACAGTYTQFAAYTFAAINDDGLVYPGNIL